MGWAIAGVVIGLIGTAISTYASYEQSQAQQRAARSEAKFREAEAEAARQAAAYEERQYRRRIDLLLGKQIAITAAAGIDPTSGSPLMMELANVRQKEMEAQNIRRTGAVSASASEFEARLARYRAAIYGRQGGYALAAGGLKAGGSILSGWYDYSQTQRSPTADYVRKIGQRGFRPGISQGE